ncbi:hypothetical protein HDV00_002479 [Rhizophlyctis rosea]|nr:hypothetical protein HDV00_002479 [Rhizophlyctis rosea]
MLGITTVFTTISFILITLYVTPPHFERSGGHRPIGLLILIGMYIQVALGYFINYMFDINRTSIPWWDKLHWWLGRGLFLLAVINIYLGLDLYSNYGDINLHVFAGLYWTWIVIGIIVLFAGHFIHGAKHHGGNYSAPVGSVDTI